MCLHEAVKCSVFISIRLELTLLRQKWRFQIISLRRSVNATVIVTFSSRFQTILRRGGELNHSCFFILLLNQTSFKSGLWWSLDRCNNWKLIINIVIICVKKFIQFHIYLSYKMFSSDMYPSRVSRKYCFTTDRLELADLRIADAWHFANRAKWSSYSIQYSTAQHSIV